MENFFDQEKSLLVKTSLKKEKSWFVGNVLMKANFLDEGKPLFVENFIDKGTIFACGKLSLSLLKMKSYNKVKT